MIEVGNIFKVFFRLKNETKKAWKYGHIPGVLIFFLKISTPNEGTLTRYKGELIFLENHEFFVLFY